jgi:hypothetical protein
VITLPPQKDNMACDFDIQIKDSADAFLSRAQSLAQKLNGSVNGDTAKGSFNLSTPFGGVEGSYTVADAIVHINVTEKPFFMTCDSVAELMRGKLS